MVWHIALTLLCLICIIGSIIFKERFSFLFPEMIIVAFYVMIFSLLLPLMIQKLNSVQDLYIVILFGFIFLVFIIVLIHVIKRLKSKSRNYVKVNEAKVNMDNAIEKEQLSLQKIRLKQIISEQRNSMAQQTPAFNAAKAPSKEFDGAKQKTETAVKEVHLSRPLDTEIRNEQSKDETLAPQSSVKVPEQLIESTAGNPIKERSDVIQIEEQYVKAQLHENIAPREILQVKEEVYAAHSEQQAEHAQMPKLASEEEKPVLKIETDQQAATDTEKEPVLLALDQKVDRYEKNFQSVLFYKERGSYKKALQELKKLHEDQTLPERRKRLEMEILKILAVSGEYQEATNEVYTFLSNGYSLNEEENKEIMDILYLLQENA